MPGRRREMVRVDQNEAPDQLSGVWLVGSLSLVMRMNQPYFMVEGRLLLWGCLFDVWDSNDCGMEYL